MSTLHQLKEGLTEAWDSLLDGWQRLYRRAAGAITKFLPGEDESAGRLSENRNTGWGVLAAEVFDDDDRVVVRLEVPGMTRDQIELHVDDRYLVVAGEKRVQHEEQDGRYHVSECAYGRFERAIPLPVPVRDEQANASYANGVLRVELPKSDTHKKRKIDVLGGE